MEAATVFPPKIDVVSDTRGAKVFNPPGVRVVKARRHDGSPLHQRSPKRRAVEFLWMSWRLEHKAIRVFGNHFFFERPRSGFCDQEFKAFLEVPKRRFSNGREQ